MRTSKSLGSLLLTKAGKGKLGSTTDLQQQQYPPDPNAYDLIAIIGQGVSATVYLALCTPLGSHVAVKAINLELLSTPWEDLVHEAQTMRATKHPGILPLHCSFVAGQQLWLVMPYMEGGSVAHLMRHSQPDGLTEVLIASIGRPVLEGLAYMHANNAIHRDVKAGNVLVDKDGRVALADLGVSATFDRDQEWGQHLRCRNTFVGTPCWMAPEVLEQADYGGAADIWSFGITLLEMAHGHAPFSKLPPMKVLMLTLQGEPPQLEREYHHRTFSAAMREVVAKCLQKEPGKRPSARALLEHRFFRQARDPPYIKSHLLAGLPPLPQRVAEIWAGKAATSARDNERRAVASQAAYVEDVLQWDFNSTAAAASAAALTADGGAQQPPAAAGDTAQGQADGTPATAAAAAAAAGGVDKDTAPGKDTSTVKGAAAGSSQALPVNGSRTGAAATAAAAVPPAAQRTGSVARQSGRFVVWEGGEPPPPPDSPVKDQHQAGPAAGGGGAAAAGGLCRQRSISSPSLYLRHPSPDPSKILAAQLQQMDAALAAQTAAAAAAEAGPQQQQQQAPGDVVELELDQQQQQQQQKGLIAEAAPPPPTTAEAAAPGTDIAGHTPAPAAAAGVSAFAAAAAEADALAAAGPATTAAATAGGGSRPVSPGRPGSRAASPLPRLWGAFTDTLKHVLHREPSPGPGSSRGGGAGAGVVEGEGSLPVANANGSEAALGGATEAGATPPLQGTVATHSSTPEAAAAAALPPPAAGGGAAGKGGPRGGVASSGKPPLPRAPTPPPPLAPTTSSPPTTATTTTSSSGSGATSPPGALSSPPGVSPPGVLRMQQPTAVVAPAAAAGALSAAGGAGAGGGGGTGGDVIPDHPPAHQLPPAAADGIEPSFSDMLLPPRSQLPQLQVRRVAAESEGDGPAERDVSFTDALQLQQRRDQSPRSPGAARTAAAAAAAAAAAGVSSSRPAADAEPSCMQAVAPSTAAAAATPPAAGAGTCDVAGSKAHQQQQQHKGSEAAADAAASADAGAIKKAGRFTIRQN